MKKILLLLTALLMTSGLVRAQETEFTPIADIWENPVSIRNINPPFPVSVTPSTWDDVIKYYESWKWHPGGLTVRISTTADVRWDNSIPIPENVAYAVSPSNVTTYIPVTFDSNSSIRLTFSPASIFTEDGEYMFYLELSKFTYTGGDDLPNVSWSFKVSDINGGGGDDDQVITLAEANFSVNPAANEEQIAGGYGASQLKKITLKYDGESFSGFNPFDTEGIKDCVTILNESGDKVASITPEYIDNEIDPVTSFNINVPDGTFATLGKYNFVVDLSKADLQNNAEKSLFAKKFGWMYKVIEEVVENITLPNAAATATPAPGEYYASDMKNGVSLYMNSFIQDTSDLTDLVTVTGPNGVSKKVTPILSGRNIITGLKENDFTTPGKYTISVAVGKLSYFGSPAPAQNIVWEYTINETAAPTGDYMDMPEGAYVLLNSTGSPLTFPQTVKQIASAYDLYFKNVYTTISGTSAYDKCRIMKDGVLLENTYNTMSYLVGDPDKDILAYINPAITEPGEYYLIYPLAGLTATTAEGNVELKDVKVGPFIIEEVTLPKVDAQVEFIPANGDEIELSNAPKALVVKIANATSLTSTAALGNLQVYSPRNVPVTMRNGTISEGNKITYWFADDFVAQTGKYTVNFIPGTLVKGNTAEGNEIQFAETTYSCQFTITPDPVLPDVPEYVTEVNPADGSNDLTEIQNIKITCEWDGFMGYGALPNVENVTVACPDGSEVKSKLMSVDNGSKLAVNLDEALTAPGDYTVTINLENVRWGSMESGLVWHTLTAKDRIVLHYTIAGGEPTLPAYVTEIDPENNSTLPSLSRIKFTAKPGENFMQWLIMGSLADRVTITGPNDFNQKYNLNWWQGSGTSGSLYVDCPITTPGDYTVEISLSGLQYFNGSMQQMGDNDKFVLHYTISTPSAIEGIDAEEADAVYYDLNGRRVNGTPDAGIYIRVAGDKVTKVVKK